MRFSGHVPLGGDPGADPGHVGETMSLDWPGNASGSPRKNWSKLPGTGMFGFLCSSCCTPGSTPGEAVDIGSMDGWMDEGMVNVSPSEHPRFQTRQEEEASPST